MFSFLKSIFSNNKKFKLGMRREKEISFCERLGEGIREYKKAHYNEITWENAIEMFVEEETSSQAEHDRLLLLMKHFTFSDSSQLQDTQSYYISVFPSEYRKKKANILSKNIDKYYKEDPKKIKDDYENIIINFGDPQYTQLLELPKKYDFEEIFKNWVKKVDIKDDELKNILYYAESNQILIKKKEKNRLYYKINDDGSDITEKLKNVALSIYLEEYNEVKKMAMYAVDRILIDIEFEGYLVYKIIKSQQYKSKKYDWLLENDFFKIGKKGAYYVRDVPFVFERFVNFHHSCIVCDKPKIKHSKEYDKLIAENNIHTVFEMIEEK